jgi:hypothetical protein
VIGRESRLFGSDESTLRISREIPSLSGSGHDLEKLSILVERM